MGNFKAQEGNLTHWTKLAKECYSINSMCKQCDFIPKQFKYICKVKYYVPELYKKFGDPNKKEKEEIMVRQNYLTLDQLSQITGLQSTTIRTYLCRAEFEKYADRIKVESRYRRVFILNKDFIDDFYNFLIVKKQKQHAEALKNYWNIYQKLGDKPEMNNFTLEEKYNMVNNQYQSLLKRYKEVLLINKKLQVIEHICQEPADNMAVFDLQNRIKEVLSE